MIQQETKSNIRIFGIGGGGSKLVDYMQQQGASDADIVVCNTSIEELYVHGTSLKLHLGNGKVGSGSNTYYAANAALNSLHKIKKCLEGAKLAVIVSSLGGGTGTAVAPIFAKESKAMGIVTLWLVTLPFRFEGEKKLETSQEGLKQLARYSDSIYIFNNQSLMDLYPELGIDKAFELVQDRISKMVLNLIDCYDIDLTTLPTCKERG